MRKKKIKSAYEIFKTYLRKYPNIVISLFVADTIAGIKPYINIVLLGYVTDSFISRTEIREVLVHVFATLLLMFALGIVEGRCREWFNQKNEFFKELEAPMFSSKSVKMDYEYLEDNHVQDIRFHSFNNSYFGTVGFLLYQIDLIWSAFISVICALTVAFPVLYRYGDSDFIGFLLSFMLIFILITLIIANYKNNRRYSQKNIDFDKMYSHETFKYKYYADSLINIENHKSIRLFDEDKIITNKINDIYCKFKNDRNAQTSNFQKRDKYSEVLNNLCCIIIYLFIIFKAYRGYLSVGAVVKYAAAIIKLTKSLSEIINQFTYMNLMFEYCLEYSEFENLHDTGEYRAYTNIDANNLQIEFKNVSYRYPGTNIDILHNINLKLDMQNGKKIAIVGKNGSGKTTLIKILCGLIMPTKGNIYINGEKITKENRQKMYSLIAAVFQDFNIFSFAIDENITIDNEVDEEKLSKTIEQAGFSQRYKELIKGGKTIVGKDIDSNGVNFSGGEKQKIAIARSLYKDSHLIIMDEPTSALDPIAECEIFESYSRLIENKSAIYISHRLASCKICDEIIVLDHGNVLERGTHEHLLQKGGLYNDMWNAQAKYYQIC